MNIGHPISPRALTDSDLGETYATAVAAMVRIASGETGTPREAADEVVFYIDEDDWDGGTENSRTLKFAPLMQLRDETVIIGTPVTLGNAYAVCADTTGAVSGAARPFLVGDVIAVGLMAIEAGSSDDWTSTTVRMLLNNQRVG